MNATSNQGHFHFQRGRTPRAIHLLIATLACAIGALAAEPSTPFPSGSGPEAGSYQIRNKKFGDLLRPKDASNANGTRIVLYPAQPWKCMTWKLLPASEGAFHLQNHFTSKTFAADTESVEAQPQVSQVPYAAVQKDRQAWRFDKLPDGTFKIIEPKSGRALTAVKDAIESSPRVVLAAWQDTDAQKWELQKIDPKDLTM